MTAVNPGLDLWRAGFTPLVEGQHRFEVRAWIDDFGSWAAATRRKLDAGVVIDSERLEGAAILERAAGRHDAAGRPAEAEALRVAAGQLRAGDTSPLTDRGGERRLSPAQLVHASFEDVDRGVVGDLRGARRARAGAVQQLVRAVPPVVGSAARGVHGTLADVERQLDYVAEMGFDILYLPPIHPIGRAFRKGPNNTEQAAARRRGQPVGHRRPRGRAHGHPPAAGHPRRPALAAAGVRPQRHRAGPRHRLPVLARPSLGDRAPRAGSGTGPTAPSSTPRTRPRSTRTSTRSTSRARTGRACGQACATSFAFWMDEGVRVFRVDNPHTKPFAFWEWVIAELRRRDPGVILLSEAFSRPRIMHRLTQVGLHALVLVLPVAGGQARAGGVLHRAVDAAVGRRVPALGVAQHARHPAVAPAWTPAAVAVRGAGVRRGDAVAVVGHLRAGVRAGRIDAGGQRQGGVPRLGEVPAASGGTATIPGRCGPSSPRSTGSAPRTWRCTRCGRCASTRSRTTSCCASRRRRTRARRSIPPPATLRRSLVVANLDPHNGQAGHDLAGPARAGRRSRQALRRAGPA